MDVRRYAIAALFAGISSCGGVPEDTAVSTGTPAVEGPVAAAEITTEPAIEAAVSADGSAYATWDDHTTTIVRVADGESVVIEGAPEGLEWMGSFARWSSRVADHVVDARTLAHVSIHAAGGVVLPKSGAFVVTWTNGESNGIVEVRDRLGEEPRIRIVAASVSSPVVDEAGKHVAWTETPVEPEQPVWIHTIDLTAGAHVRFRGQGAPCQISSETIDSLSGAVLRTEDTCNPGCGGISYTPSYVEYDASSGRIVRRFEGPTLPPIEP
jgi:hypothetical protein